MLKMTRVVGVLGLCLVMLGGCSDEVAGDQSGGCVAPEVFDPIQERCRIVGEAPKLDVGGEDVGGGEDVAVGDIGGGEDVGGGEDGGVDAGDGADVGGALCEPFTMVCVDGWTLGMCNEEGDGFLQTVACWEGDLCRGDQCVPAAGACEAGERTCQGAQVALVCNGEGTDFEQVACEAGELCYQGECAEYACVPNARTCEGQQVMECSSDGQTLSAGEVCGAGLKCLDGACVDDPGPCANLKGYLGCEFLAADLDHMRPGDELRFGVTVSNSHWEPVEVKIYNGDDALVAERTIAVNALEVFELPRRDVNNTGLTRQSYRIETTGPVTAHQFNPLNRSGVASTDASLLLPVYSLGREYMVLGWPSINSGRVTEGRAYFTIIAARDGTEVTVKPNAAIEAGGGVAAMAAGETRSFTLERGQVLSLSTANRSGFDLSGSEVTSSQPVAVFSGNECADVPLGTAACDHLEEQLFPLANWGRSYVAAKFAPRGTEVDVYRLIASEDGTQVTLTPPVGNLSQITLHRGQVREFSTSQSFVVDASAPVLLAQFMVGAGAPGTCTGLFCSGTGDPAFLLNVATSQYQNEYIVYVPSGFNRSHLSITAEAGTQVQLDGQALGAAQLTVGTTGWQVFQPQVAAGIHRVVADRPVGLSVYGYSPYVSYAYPGGIALD